MKTIHEALLKTQNRGAGLMNRSSEELAQALLEENECVHAAASANIFTRKGHFPGIVAVTNQRVFAACGLPGIRRLISFPMEDLVMCRESVSPLTYRADFQTRTNTFSISLAPAAGKTFSARVKSINDSLKVRADAPDF